MLNSDEEVSVYILWPASVPLPKKFTPLSCAKYLTDQKEGILTLLKGKVKNRDIATDLCSYRKGVVLNNRFCLIEDEIEAFRSIDELFGEMLSKRIDFYGYLDLVNKEVESIVKDSEETFDEFKKQILFDALKELVDIYGLPEEKTAKSIARKFIDYMFLIPE